MKKLLKRHTPSPKPLPLILGLVLGASCVLAQTPPPIGSMQYNGSAWVPLTVTNAALADTLTYTPPPGALYCQYTSTATNFSITGNVVTVTATNTFVAGQQPLLFGWTTATYLNNFVVTILSSGLSGSQYKFNFTHADVGSTGDTGTANLWVPATSACFGGGSATTATNLVGGSIGVIPYQSAANTTAFLAANTAATDQVLVSHGTGAAGLAPTFSNAPALAITNMTGTGTNLTFVNPALGTPASGVATNLTGTAAGLTAGLAQGLTGTPNITVGTITGTLGTLSGNGAASTSPLAFTGSLFTGGSGTTTFPYIFLQPSGATAETGWSTNGTFIGINSASGFTGDFMNFHLNNGASAFRVDQNGAVYSSNAFISSRSDNAIFLLAGNTTAAINMGTSAAGNLLTYAPNTQNLTVAGTTGTLTYPRFATQSNCANAASPAVCGTAASGAVTIAAGSTTVVVNTTAVTANSRITLQTDDTVTIAATTCNSTLATLVGGVAVTARTAGTSFTISFNGVIATNPLCIVYNIVD